MTSAFSAVAENGKSMIHEKKESWQRKMRYNVYQLSLLSTRQNTLKVFDSPLPGMQRGDAAL